MTPPALRTFALALAAACAALALQACSTAATQPAAAAAPANVVRGSVLYRDRTALPENAMVRVRIVDGSPTPTAGMVYAETTFPTRGQQVPIPFALPYDPAKLEAGHLYTLRAYILV